MRLVIDTNVFISALVASGKSHEVVEYCLVNHHVVGSEFILNELGEKLRTKFKFAVEIADEAIGLLKARMEVIAPTPLPAPACRDADDDQILAAAVSGACERIITGDKDLLAMNPFGNITIQTPGEFATVENMFEGPAKQSW